MGSGRFGALTPPAFPAAPPVRPVAPRRYGIGIPAPLDPNLPNPNRTITRNVDDTRQRVQRACAMAQALGLLQVGRAEAEAILDLPGDIVAMHVIEYELVTQHNEGMIVQKRSAFGLEDLTDIRITCKKCDHEIVFDLEKGQEMPHACPFCNWAWAHDEERSELDIVHATNRSRGKIERLSTSCSRCATTNRDSGRICAHAHFEYDQWNRLTSEPSAGYTVSRDCDPRSRSLEHEDNEFSQ